MPAPMTPPVTPPVTPPRRAGLLRRLAALLAGLVAMALAAAALVVLRPASMVALDAIDRLLGLTGTAPWHVFASLAVQAAILALAGLWAYGRALGHGTGRAARPARLALVGLSMAGAFGALIFAWMALRLPATFLPATILPAYVALGLIWRDWPLGRA